MYPRTEPSCAFTLKSGEARAHARESDWMKIMSLTACTVHECDGVSLRTRGRPLLRVRLDMRVSCDVALALSGSIDLRIFLVLWYRLDATTRGEGTAVLR